MPGVDITVAAGSGGLAADGTTTGATSVAQPFTNGIVRSGMVVRVSAQFDKTTNTTLANIPGLSVTLLAGATYLFRATLFATVNGVGLGKIALAGTCTATSLIAIPVMISSDSATAVPATRVTALGAATADPSGGTSSTYIVTGTITVNAGGTFTVQFAQNVSSGTSSILVGSTLEVEKVA